MHATKVHLFTFPRGDPGGCSSDAFSDDSVTQEKQSVASQ